MPDREELIRRLIDGELSQAELTDLLSIAAVDRELVRRIESARALAALLRAAPPVVDPGRPLTDRIMRTLPARPRRDSAWRRLWRALAQPVAVPLGAAVLVVLLLAALLLWRWQLEASGPAGEGTVAPASGRGAAGLAAAAGEREGCAGPSEVMVRFFLAAPGASRVSLAGDFNGWSTDEIELSASGEDGIWTVTIPLAPGRYQYKFLVDGERWVADPHAPAHSPDGFGGTNALLAI